MSLKSFDTSSGGLRQILISRLNILEDVSTIACIDLVLDYKIYL